MLQSVVSAHNIAAKAAAVWQFQHCWLELVYHSSTQIVVLSPSHSAQNASTNQPFQVKRRQRRKGLRLGATAPDASEDFLDFVGRTGSPAHTAARSQ